MSSSHTPHDHDLHFDEEELEHGWAGELELVDERPSTGLEGDPRDRKWVLLGLGFAGVLAASFVLVAATTDAGQAMASSIETVPASAPVEIAEIVDPASSSVATAPIVAARADEPTGVEMGVTVGVEMEKKVRPHKAPPPPERIEPTTLASGSRAAVLDRPSRVAPQPAARVPAAPSSVEPAVEAEPELEPESRLVEVDTPSAAPTLPPEPIEPPLPGKPQVADPEVPPPAHNDAQPSNGAPTDVLPDVEGWDDADDDAVHEPG